MPKNLRGLARKHKVNFSSVNRTIAFIQDCDPEDAIGDSFMWRFIGGPGRNQEIAFTKDGNLFRFDPDGNGQQIPTTIGELDSLMPKYLID